MYEQRYVVSFLLSNMRQLDHECGSFIQFRTDHDVSLMEEDDLFGECHANAMPFRLILVGAPIEEGEDLLLVGLGQAIPVVGETDCRPWPMRGDLDNGGLVGRVFAIVLDQVGEGDGEQVEIAVDGDQPLIVVVHAEQELDVIIRMGPQDL